MLVLACHLSSYAKEPEKPSMAFLEYLAELEQVDGKWVSPLDLQQEKQSAAQILQVQEEKERVVKPKAKVSSEEQKQEVKK